ncbi:hypothetical protein [Streptomyces sp. NPDC060031]|uniref:hypothetical protein n=1 Tax=Streptomyces sp. NPDC060031 TaxID=3347043 RepID=UPI0036999315
MDNAGNVSQDANVSSYAQPNSAPAAFADPVAGPVLTTLAPGAHPRIGSDGDLTGDGLADLWSADAAGEVTVFPGTGTAGVHPTVSGFGPAA